MVLLGNVRSKLEIGFSKIQSRLQNSWSLDLVVSWSLFVWSLSWPACLSLSLRLSLKLSLSLSLSLSLVMSCWSRSWSWSLVLVPDSLADTEAAASLWGQGRGLKLRIRVEG